MKLVLAFLAGAFLAGGLAYWAAQPAAPVEPEQRIERISAQSLEIPVQTAPPKRATPAVPQPVKRPAPSPAKKRLRQFQPPVVSAHHPLPPSALPNPPVVRAIATAETPPALAFPAGDERIPPPPEPNRVTIGAGTVLSVRLAEDLSSDSNAAGDLFSATLDQPLVVEGFVIAERLSHVEGSVIGAQRSGKAKGSAALVLQLTRLESSDGQMIDIQTGPFTKKAKSERGRDIAKVGALASIGAAIGAAVGGGSGAAIGAAAGGAAGTGAILLTRGAPATLPAETRLPFRLSVPVTITERIN